MFIELQEMLGKLVALIVILAVVLLILNGLYQNTKKDQPDNEQKIQFSTRTLYNK